MYVKRFTYFENGTVEHQESRNAKEIYDLVKEMGNNCVFVLEADDKFLVIHEFLSREKFIKWLKTKLIL